MAGRDWLREVRGNLILVSKSDFMHCRFHFQAFFSFFSPFSDVMKSRLPEAGPSWT